LPSRAARHTGEREAVEDRRHCAADIRHRQSAHAGLHALANVAGLMIAGEIKPGLIIRVANYL
jgi:hypothetical protein